MKILQLGLGSMGKRRVRNMQALGLKDIIGFDLREDRRLEAERKHGIKTVGKLSEDLLNEREVYIISTPPGSHDDCIKLALKYRKAAFVEASVLRQNLPAFDRQAKRTHVRIMPSCTFRYHPAIKIIKELVQGGKYGKVCNLSYHMGQYLPDWHPWESIKDYYVSKKATSGGREMVPYELTWIIDVFGIPKSIFGFKGGNHDMGVDIDDTYAIVMNFKGFQGTLLVDVVCRFATRSVIVNLEGAQIRWNWEDEAVKLYDAKKQKWQICKYKKGPAATGYNSNIIEDMYVEEMSTFFNAVQTGKPFPNTLKEDAAILGMLETVENSGVGKIVKK